jgi:hypothetical protein
MLWFLSLGHTLTEAERIPASTLYLDSVSNILQTMGNNKAGLLEPLLQHGEIWTRIGNIVLL